MSNTKEAGEITGKIDANPNPISFGQAHVVISWETDDPIGAEIRVLTAPSDEKVLSRGHQSGQVEIPWIVDSRIYYFRLYATSRPDVPIDSVKVNVTSIPAVWPCASLRMK